jgi:hypothetical protein
MYELWERVAPVPATRQVLDASGAPGTVMNCRRPLVRALSRRPGVAAVMATPVMVGLSALQPGRSETVKLRLPPGRWDLSLQYTSPVTLGLRAGASRWTMPAYLDRPGPVFNVGSLSSDGTPMALSVHAARPSVLSGANLVAFISTVYATRAPATRTLVPLSRACGRYVDWYRLSS